MLVVLGACGVLEAGEVPAVGAFAVSGFCFCSWPLHERLGQKALRTSNGKMMDVKQLLRIAWNGLVAVSALLFVATLISVRSYSTSDSFGYVWGPDIGKHVAMISFSRAYFRAQSLH